MNINQNGQPSNLRTAAYKDALLKDLKETSKSLSQSKDKAVKFLATAASDDQFEQAAKAAWVWIT